MIKNYLITALRNIFRNRLFSVLNILGLALGMTTTILILLWVQDELSYDKYDINYKNIYRVIQDTRTNKGRQNWAGTTNAMGETMYNDYPEVLNFCRLVKSSFTTVEIDGDFYTETNLGYADSSFFEIFTIPLVYGYDKNILNKPNLIALSQTTAVKYFGPINPIGKNIRIGSRTFMISGVYNDIPINSHFHFNAIMSMETLPISRNYNWDQAGNYTYVVLKEGTDLKALHSKMKSLITNYWWPVKQKFYTISLDELLRNGSGFFLQPITDIHLKSDLYSEIEPNSDITYVYIFSFIAVFILIIACINFMNLSTAKSETRSKEIGIRKVSGATKYQIVFQFLIETVIITILSFFITIFLVELTLPAFNHFSGKEINISYFDFLFMIKLFGILLITVFVAGSYPSIYLSAIKPILALKGGVKPGLKGIKLRNILVVVQLIITIALISCSLIVYRQISFINNKDLGFDKKNIICLHKANLLENKAHLFKEEMLMNPEFISGTISSYLPVLSISYNYRNGVVPDGDVKKSIGLPHWAVDFDYIETLKLEIIEGREFDREFLTDSSALILNEAAVKEFGWDDPFDHFIIKSAFRNGVDSDINFKIIGVVKDFHFESLQNNIAPLLLFINGKSGNIISFRYNSEDVNKVIELLESKWKEFLPDQPFQYSFLDEEFNSLYFREQRIGKIMVIFTVFSIVIASLGLFGLSTFLAVKRTKEIGIRKVNGASAFSIFSLFSMDTIKLCIISFVIAIPVTWYFMDNWLSNFAYRINIQWPIFLISGFIAFTIAILTVSYQGYTASVRNPVDALKYE